MNLAEHRILVTGGHGFLGRHLMARLDQAGCKNCFAPRRQHYDLTCELDVHRLFIQYKPEIVFHLAATCGGIEANRQNPGRFLYDNAVMGMQVMEQARLHGVKKFVLVGTTCSYPRDAPTPLREDDLWNGYPEETNAPYGLAKRMLMVQAQAYRQQYGFNAITLLPANLYGPGDNFDLETSHVIPALIRKAYEAKQAGHMLFSAWGDGTATREFLYVKDAAEALVLAAERYDKPEPVNIGTGKETRIRAVADTICAMVGFQGDISWEASKPSGQPRRVLDVSRAKSFGFTAKTDLEAGLQETADWYVKQRREQLAEAVNNY